MTGLNQNVSATAAAASIAAETHAKAVEGATFFATGPAGVMGDFVSARIAADPTAATDRLSDQSRGEIAAVAIGAIPTGADCGLVAQAHTCTIATSVSIASNGHSACA